MFNGRRQPSRGGTSRMMREYQVRICERLGVKFPGPTRQNRTLKRLRPMSALPPKADIAERQLDVRFVPDSDMALAQKMIGIAWPRAMFEAAVFDRL
jgi:hypothetical protein